MRKKDCLERPRKVVAASMAGVLLAFTGLAVPANAETLSAESTVASAMEGADLFAEEAEGNLENGGVTYHYRQFYEGAKRAIELTNKETGATQVFSYDPATQMFFVDGVATESLVTVGMSGNDQIMPMAEGDWVSQGNTTVYLSFGATATAMDIAIKISLIAGTGGVSAVYSVISSAVVSAVTAAGGCYVTYRVEIQTIGWYQNQRVVFSIRAGSSYFGPWTVYLPPRS